MDPDHPENESHEEKLPEHRDEPRQEASMARGDGDPGGGGRTPPKRHSKAAASTARSGKPASTATPKPPKGTPPPIPPTPYQDSPWAQPVTTAADLQDILTLHGLIPNVPPALQDAAKGLTDRQQLIALAIDMQLPTTTRSDQVSTIRAVIAGNDGGSSYLSKFPDIGEALLSEVYKALPSHQQTQQAIGKLDPEYLRELATQQFPDMAKALYEDQIAASIKRLGSSPSAELVHATYALMLSNNVAIDAIDFDQQVFGLGGQANELASYDSFFTKKLVQDFTTTPTSTQRMSAIEYLQQLGISPTVKDAEQWGRVALGLTGMTPDSGDIMALASYGVGTNFSSIDSIDLPDFDEPGLTGLKPDNINVCADLYYIHKFDQLGVFRATDALAVKFFENINLGMTMTAQAIYRYIKRRPLRFPDEDRQRITNSLFEHGPFRQLMGRMVEAVVEYMRVRNAGELFTAQTAGVGPDPTAYTRSTVIRAVQNLQRYLSAQGGIAPFVARESGAQLKECFDILNSNDLKMYFGGPFTEGMWGILDGILHELDHHAPEVDRMRTLAVWGRKILQWLAANTSNTATMGDTELMDLADRVQNWLAAYKRPEYDPEPDWLHDDGSHPEDLDPGAQAAHDAIQNALAGTPLAGYGQSPGSGQANGQATGDGQAPVSGQSPSSFTSGQSPGAPNQPDVMSGVS